MPSPEAGATTPAASPASTHFATVVPARQRLQRDRRAFATHRHQAIQPAGAAQVAAVPVRNEKPLSALPVPMLTVSPCGKTHP
jgi:hypothetical protein